MAGDKTNAGYRDHFERFQRIPANDLAILYFRMVTSKAFNLIKKVTMKIWKVRQKQIGNDDAKYSLIIQWPLGKGIVILG